MQLIADAGLAASNAGGTAVQTKPDRAECRAEWAHQLAMKAGDCISEAGAGGRVLSDSEAAGCKLRDDLLFAPACGSTQLPIAAPSFLRGSEAAWPGA